MPQSCANATILTLAYRPKNKPEVQLNPRLQAELLAQMREEQAAAMRTRRLKRYVLLPAIVATTITSLLMALSDDSSVALVGNVLASSLLLYFWKVRKHIAASVGLG